MSGLQNEKLTRVRKQKNILDVLRVSSYLIYYRTSDMDIACMHLSLYFILIMKRLSQNITK